MLGNKSGILSAVAVGIALTLVLLGGFAFLEKRELDKWDDPAPGGCFVVAFRVDGGGWPAIEALGNELRRVAPKAKGGDSTQGIYQGWWSSGWQRIHRCGTEANLKEVATACSKAADRYGRSHGSDSAYRVAVVDAQGKTHGSVISR